MPKIKTEKTAKKADSAWVKLKPSEIESLVINLGRKNTPPEKIGLILRDEHGIPKTKIFGKKISQILKENKLSHSSEKENIMKKVEILKKHSEKHKHDYSAQRAIIEHNSRLAKYKR